MALRIFVYGTLKQGFCNAGVNAGRRLPGVYETVQPWPLYVVGPLGLPWLVATPGQGQRVAGQVYDVDAQDLPRLDALERVTQPGWYTRQPVAVRRQGHDAPALDVEAYFGCASRLASEAVHAGPLAEYTLDHQALYRGRDA